MKRVRNEYLLGVLALMGACGKSSPSNLPEASDAGWDCLVDALPETVGADGAAERADVSLPVECAPMVPDSAVDLPMDGAMDSSSDAATCWYLSQGGGWSFRSFQFSFMAPNQSSYSCQNTGRGLAAPDASAQWPTELTGRTTSVSDVAFTIDTCQPGGTCGPTLYAFTLTAPGAKLTLPVGRKVKVFWQITAVFNGCTYWLSVLDAESGPTSGLVWFLGNGGLQASATALPFDVNLQGRLCGSQDALPSLVGGVGDKGDFAFTFASKYGPASSLAIGTQEAGTFTFTTDQGFQQALDIHCLDAFQSLWMDDYWNWDYWAINQTAVALATDAGAVD
jgi:hypothetical protein